MLFIVVPQKAIPELPKGLLKLFSAGPASPLRKAGCPGFGLVAASLYSGNHRGFLRR